MRVAERDTNTIYYKWNSEKGGCPSLYLINKVIGAVMRFFIPFSGLVNRAFGHKPTRILAGLPDPDGLWIRFNCMRQPGDSAAMARWCSHLPASTNNNGSEPRFPFL